MIAPTAAEARSSRLIAARSLCVVVLAVLALTGTVPAGHAKGPTDVAVSGPGVDAKLTWDRYGDGVDMESLGEAARLFQVLEAGQLRSAPDLTAEQLGPRYVLDWTVANVDVLVQHAYPFAEGGAWVRFLPARSGWGSGDDGWVRAPALRDQLLALGAGAEPRRPPLTIVEPAVTAADPTESREDPRPAYDVVVPAGILLVALAGVLIVRRRQLSR